MAQLEDLLGRVVENTQPIAEMRELIRSLLQGQTPNKTVIPEMKSSDNEIPTDAKRNEILSEIRKILEKSQEDFEEQMKEGEKAVADTKALLEEIAAVKSSQGVEKPAAATPTVIIPEMAPINAGIGLSDKLLASLLDVQRNTLSFAMDISATGRVVERTLAFIATSVNKQAPIQVEGVVTTVSPNLEKSVSAISDSLEQSGSKASPATAQPMPTPTLATVTVPLQWGELSEQPKIPAIKDSRKVNVTWDVSGLTKKAIKDAYPTDIDPFKVPTEWKTSGLTKKALLDEYPHDIDPFNVPTEWKTSGLTKKALLDEYPHDIDPFNVPTEWNTSTLTKVSIKDAFPDLEPLLVPLQWGELTGQPTIPEIASATVPVVWAKITEQPTLPPLQEASMTAKWGTISGQPTIPDITAQGVVPVVWGELSGQPTIPDISVSKTIGVTWDTSSLTADGIKKALPPVEPHKIPVEWRLDALNKQVIIDAFPIGMESFKVPVKWSELDGQPIVPEISLQTVPVSWGELNEQPTIPDIAIKTVPISWGQIDEQPVLPEIVSQVVPVTWGEVIGQPVIPAIATQSIPVAWTEVTSQPAVPQIATQTIPVVWGELPGQPMVPTITVQAVVPVVWGELTGQPVFPEITEKVVIPVVWGDLTGLPVIPNLATVAVKVVWDTIELTKETLKAKYPKIEPFKVPIEWGELKGTPTIPPVSPVTIPTVMMPPQQPNPAVPPEAKAPTPPAPPKPPVPPASPGGPGEPKMPSPDSAGKAGDAAGSAFMSSFDKWINKLPINLGKILDSSWKNMTKVMFGRLDLSRKYYINIRQIAYQTQGITRSTEDLQKRFAELGKTVAETGENLSVMQKEYLKNLKKGTISQKQALTVTKAGLNLATMIGDESNAVADTLYDWHLNFRLSVNQVAQVSREIQDVARWTGVTGEKLAIAVKKADTLAKVMDKTGTLTAQAVGNMIRLNAIAEKFGVGDSVENLNSALASSHTLFMKAGPQIQNLLFGAAASVGKLAELKQGVILQSREGMKRLAQGMENMLRRFGVSLEEIENMNPERLMRLNLQLGEAYGMQANEIKKVIETYREASKGFGDRMRDINKQLEKGNLTAQERLKLERDRQQLVMNEGFRFLTMFDEAAKKGGNMANVIDGMMGKMSADMKKDLEEMGISVTGDAQMMQKIFNMTAKKLKQAGSKIDFTPEIERAMATGDVVKMREVLEKMNEEQRKLGIETVKKLDPFTEVKHTLNKINESVRNFAMPIVAAILGLMGPLGLIVLNTGIMAASLVGPMSGALGKLVGFFPKLVRAKAAPAVAGAGGNLAAGLGKAGVDAAVKSTGPAIADATTKAVIPVATQAATNAASQSLAAATTQAGAKVAANAAPAATAAMDKALAKAPKGFKMPNLNFKGMAGFGKQMAMGAVALGAVMVGLVALAAVMTVLVKGLSNIGFNIGDAQKSAIEIAKLMGAMAILTGAVALNAVGLTALGQLVTISGWAIPLMLLGAGSLLLLVPAILVLSRALNEIATAIVEDIDLSSLIDTGKKTAALFISAGLISAACLGAAVSLKLLGGLVAFSGWAIPLMFLGAAALLAMVPATLVLAKAVVSIAQVLTKGYDFEAAIETGKAVAKLLLIAGGIAAACLGAVWALSMLPLMWKMIGLAIIGAVILYKMVPAVINLAKSVIQLATAEAVIPEGINITQVIEKVNTILIGAGKIAGAVLAAGMMLAGVSLVGLITPFMYLGAKVIQKLVPGIVAVGLEIVKLNKNVQDFDKVKPEEIKKTINIITALTDMVSHLSESIVPLSRDWSRGVIGLVGGFLGFDTRSPAEKLKEGLNVFAEVIESIGNTFQRLINTLKNANFQVEPANVNTAIDRLDMVQEIMKYTLNLTNFLQQNLLPLTQTYNRGLSGVFRSIMGMQTESNAKLIQDGLEVFKTTIEAIGEEVGAIVSVINDATKFKIDSPITALDKISMVSDIMTATLNLTNFISNTMLPITQSYSGGISGFFRRWIRGSQAVTSQADKIREGVGQFKNTIVAIGENASAIVNAINDGNTLTVSKKDAYDCLENIKIISGLMQACTDLVNQLTTNIIPLTQSMDQGFGYWLRRIQGLDTRSMADQLKTGMAQFGDLFPVISSSLKTGIIDPITKDFGNIDICLLKKTGESIKAMTAILNELPLALTALDKKVSLLGKPTRNLGDLQSCTDSNEKTFADLAAFLRHGIIDPIIGYLPQSREIETVARSVVAMTTILTELPKTFGALDIVIGKLDSWPRNTEELKAKTDPYKQRFTDLATFLRNGIIDPIVEFLPQSREIETVARSVVAMTTILTELPKTFAALDIVVGTFDSPPKNTKNLMEKIKEYEKSFTNLAKFLRKGIIDPIIRYLPQSREIETVAKSVVAMTIILNQLPKTFATLDIVVGTFDSPPKNTEDLKAKIDKYQKKFIDIATFLNDGIIDPITGCLQISDEVTEVTKHLTEMTNTLKELPYVMTSLNAALAAMPTNLESKDIFENQTKTYKEFFNQINVFLREGIIVPIGTTFPQPGELQILIQQLDSILQVLDILPVFLDLLAQRMNQIATGRWLGLDCDVATLSTFFFTIANGLSTEIIAPMRTFPKAEEINTIVGVLDEVTNAIQALPGFLESIGTAMAEIMAGSWWSIKWKTAIVTLWFSGLVSTINNGIIQPLIHLPSPEDIATQVSKLEKLQKLVVFLPDVLSTLATSMEKLDRGWWWGQKWKVLLFGLWFKGMAAAINFGILTPIKDGLPTAEEIQEAADRIKSLHDVLSNLVVIFEQLAQIMDRFRNGEFQGITGITDVLNPMLQEMKMLNLGAFDLNLPKEAIAVGTNLEIAKTVFDAATEKAQQTVASGRKMVSTVTQIREDGMQNTATKAAATVESAEQALAGVGQKAQEASAETAQQSINTKATPTAPAAIGSSVQQAEEATATTTNTTTTTTEPAWWKKVFGEQPSWLDKLFSKDATVPTNTAIGSAITIPDATTVKVEQTKYAHTVMAQGQPAPQTQATTHAATTIADLDQSKIDISDVSMLRNLHRVRGERPPSIYPLHHQRMIEGQLRLHGVDSRGEGDPTAAAKRYLLERYANPAATPTAVAASTTATTQQARQLSIDTITSNSLSVSNVPYIPVDASNMPTVNSPTASVQQATTGMPTPVAPASAPAAGPLVQALQTRAITKKAFVAQAPSTVETTPVPAEPLTQALQQQAMTPATTPGVTAPVGVTHSPTMPGVYGPTSSAVQFAPATRVTLPSPIPTPPPAVTPGNTGLKASGQGGIVGQKTQNLANIETQRNQRLLGTPPAATTGTPGATATPAPARTWADVQRVHQGYSAGIPLSSPQAAAAMAWSTPTPASTTTTGGPGVIVGQNNHRLQEIEKKRDNYLQKKENQRNKRVLITPQAMPGTPAVAQPLGMPMASAATLTNLQFQRPPVKSATPAGMPAIPAPAATSPVATPVIRAQAPLSSMLDPVEQAQRDQQLQIEMNNRAAWDAAYVANQQAMAGPNATPAGLTGPGIWDIEVKRNKNLDNSIARKNQKLENIIAKRNKNLDNSIAKRNARLPNMPPTNTPTTTVNIPAHAEGGEFLVNNPRLIMVGEDGPERISIVPKKMAPTATGQPVDSQTVNNAAAQAAESIIAQATSKLDKQVSGDATAVNNLLNTAATTVAGINATLQMRTTSESAAPQVTLEQDFISKANKRAAAIERIRQERQQFSKEGSPRVPQRPDDLNTIDQAKVWGSKIRMLSTANEVPAQSAWDAMSKVLLRDTRPALNIPGMQVEATAEEPALFGPRTEPTSGAVVQGMAMSKQLAEPVQAKAKPLTDEHEKMQERYASEQAGAETGGGNKDLAVIANLNERQLEMLATIHDDLQELVAILQPSKTSGNTNGMGVGSARSQKLSPQNPADYGRWQFGRYNGNANKNVINDGQ